MTRAQKVQCAIVVIIKVHQKMIPEKSFQFRFSCANGKSKLTIGKAFQRAGIVFESKSVLIYCLSSENVWTMLQNEASLQHYIGVMKALYDT